MEIRPKAARSPTITILPTELVAQILEYDDLTESDRAAFAATCRRFKEIAYPLLYRKFEWVKPFESASVLERWIGQLGLLIEVLLEPLVNVLVGIFGQFGCTEISDKKCVAFERRAPFVREMSVLGGYRYYKEVGALIRYYGPREGGDFFVNLFHPFDNLVRIELDERAALTWSGYLTVVANILVTKSRLQHLMLRHRLGLQPLDKTRADMAPIREILERDVVAQLKTLTVILGRRFESSEMGYEHFVQLMEVLADAVEEVVTFEVFAHHSKLNEDDPILREGSVRPWVMPNLQTARLHMNPFPQHSPCRSIAEESIAKVRKLKVVCNCDVANADLRQLGKNLSAFVGLQELEIWDPLGGADWEYTEEEMPYLCEKLADIKEFLPNLRILRWILGQQHGNITCTINFDSTDPMSGMSISTSRSVDLSPRENLTETLPSRLKYIKEGYLVGGVVTGTVTQTHYVY
ncbi:hypothetical protein ABW21_db0203483 [Orbilia brochopaga]|nr:hypothetical protein ABW21_db0203483 [Drechslerella brochopaga]